MVRSAQEWERLVETDRVHRDVYTSKDIFASEIDQIFETSWVFVGAKTEVPEPGDYKTTYIGRQPVIMSRHKDGQVYVLFNRCRHRGAVVCREPRGNSSAFRCVYHGWTYDGRGELRGVPFRGAYGEEFSLADLSLRRPAHVESYRGLVFASLGDTGKSLQEYLGPARDYLDLAIDASPEGELVVQHGSENYTIRANWKLQAENLLDGYHPTFTHKVAFDAVQRRTGRNPGKGMKEGSPASTVSLPQGHGVLDYTGAGRGYSGRDTPDPAYRAALVERMGEARAKEVLASDIQIYVFPNFFLHSGRQHIRVLRPITECLTEVSASPYSLRGAPPELNKAHIRGLAWWASPAGFGQPDDIEVLERCQEGLAVSGDEWVLFNRGTDREKRSGEGVVVGDITDEVPQRGLHRAWKDLVVRSK